MKRFENFDTSSFWDDCDYSLENYVDEAPSDEMVLLVEKELGYKLPDAYVEFMKIHNGGLSNKSVFITEEFELISMTGFYSIGKSKQYSLLGERGSKFWIEEWEYPNLGIYICDTISGGHDMIALDYSNCEKNGEPEVVWVAQENDYKKTFLAKNFETFISGLYENELIEEFDEIKAEVEEKLFEICLRDLKNISMEKEIYCLNICYGSEQLIPPIFAFGESKDKEEWVKNNLNNIESYLWNIAEYSYWDKEFKIEDEATKKLFHRYNELALELELWSVQVRTILTIAKKLKKHLSEFDWNMSDDFVIAVTDLEQIDVTKNFEFLNDKGA